MLKQSESCQLITLTEKIDGKIEISDQYLYFYDMSEKNDSSDHDASETNSDFKWPLAFLKEIYLRRYNLRREGPNHHAYWKLFIFELIFLFILILKYNYN